MHEMLTDHSTRSRPWANPLADFKAIVGHEVTDALTRQGAPKPVFKLLDGVEELVYPKCGVLFWNARGNALRVVYTALDLFDVEVWGWSEKVLPSRLWVLNDVDAASLPFVVDDAISCFGLLDD